MKSVLNPELTNGTEDPSSGASKTTTADSETPLLTPQSTATSSIDKITHRIDTSFPKRRTRKDKALDKHHSKIPVSSDIIEIRDSSSKADEVRTISGHKRNSRISHDRSSLEEGLHKRQKTL
jgi:hypothetical protein